MPAGKEVKLVEGGVVLGRISLHSTVNVEYRALPYCTVYAYSSNHEDVFCTDATDEMCSPFLLHPLSLPSLFLFLSAVGTETIVIFFYDTIICYIILTLSVLEASSLVTCLISESGSVYLNLRMPGGHGAMEGAMGAMDGADHLLQA